MRFIELNYYYHGEFSKPEDVIQKHLPSNLFATHLSNKTEVILVKHLNFTGELKQDNVQYRLFKSSNSFFDIPSATHRFIQSIQPDMILVQGLIFPLQVIALRRRVGKKTRIVLQHQGEVPFRRKRFLQKWMDRCVDGYIFTSAGNADEWFEAGIIKDRKKCFEIIPSSTLFTRKDKENSKERLGMKAPINFLWVGRLNANKDPLTIWRGFEKYFMDHPNHKLYFIYGEDDMLSDIKQILAESPLLTNRVELVGRIIHEELEYWFSAADYFVSGSHREGGSYALTEAMACGCIPVVTSIPSAVKVTGDGKAGYYFQVGDPDSLYKTLMGLDHHRLKEMSDIVMNHFRQNFSPAAIADKMIEVYEHLKSK